MSVHTKQRGRMSNVEEVVRLNGIAFDPIIVKAFLLEESRFKQISDDFREDSFQISPQAANN